MKFLLTIAVMFSVFLPSAVFGNEVTAEVRGTTLYVYGDSAANSIAITSEMAGQIRVTGITSVDGQPTNVNGTDNGSVVLNGWTGGVFVYLYQGDDELVLFGIEVPGVTHLDLGSDDDLISIGSTSFNLAVNFGLQLDPPKTLTSVYLNSALRVIAAGGDDEIEIADPTVVGSTTLNCGSGFDSVVVGADGELVSPVEFQDNLVVLPGADSDYADFRRMTVGRDFVFDDSTGPLELTVTDSEIARNLLVFATSDDDLIRMSNVFTSGKLQINSENGDDEISLSGEALDLVVNCGAGDDYLELFDFASDSMDADLGVGIDSLDVFACDFQTVVCYGSTGNDWFRFESTSAQDVKLYGGGGTDTLTQVGNSFGSLKLYSIENN